MAVVRSYDWGKFFRVQEKRERMIQKGRSKRKKGGRGGKSEGQDEEDGWKVDWQKYCEDQVSGHKNIKFCTSVVPKHSVCLCVF